MTARSCCYIIEAPKGQVRAAAALVRRAIRYVIGSRRCTQAHYVSAKEIGNDPRFVIEITDEERELINARAMELGRAEGWISPPWDCYHD